MSGEKNDSRREWLPLAVAALAIAIFATVPHSAGAYAGKYSTTSPFSCGSNCSGGYELFGNTEIYCYLNADECYNTVNDCVDGDDPSQEYIEEVTIANLNGGSNFSARDNVSVTIQAYCSPDGDYIGFVYNNGSGYKHYASANCTTPGFVNITRNITLDDKGGNHTIRAIIAYSGSDGITCGEDTDTPEWTDNEDLTFLVNQNADTTPPSAFDPRPAPNSGIETYTNLEVLICVNVTDTYGISSVFVNLTGGGIEDYFQIFMAQGNQYCDGATDFEELTTYNITFTVTDSNGNVNATTKTNFTLQSTTNLSMEQPHEGELLPFTGYIPINITLNGGYNATVIYYELDGGESNYVYDPPWLNASFTVPDQDGQIYETTAAYPNLSMSFTPGENMRADFVSLSLRRNGSGTPGATVQIRNSSGGNPGSILASGTIDNSTVNDTAFTMVNITLNASVNLSQGTTYWIFLSPGSAAPDFYYWEASDDGSYSGGSFNQNPSEDLLFLVADRFKFRLQAPVGENGEHAIQVFADNDIYDPLQTPIVSFELDYAAPQVISVSYFPNSSDDVDTGVRINVTANITDNLAVGTVLLEYKVGSGQFQNTTASAQGGGIFTSNFTPSSEGNWTIRIYAEDTSGNSVYSQNTTIEVVNENEWTFLPQTFNTTSSFLGTNKSVGNITLVNPSDFNLTINISSQMGGLPAVYFNDSPESLLVYVQSGQNVSIPLVVTGKLVESNDKVTILVDPQESVNPPYSQLNFTFISFLSGPFLDIEITEYDSTVTQGQKRVTLSALITNAGNDTAYNVTSNWTLPSGWTPRTNLTIEKASMAPGEQVAYTRLVDIDSGAATGVKTITVIVNSSSNTSDTETRSVTVSAEQSTQQSQSSSGGSGGGGGRAAPRRAELTISAPQSTDGARGQNTTIVFTMANTGDLELSNFSIEVTGLPIGSYRARRLPERLSGNSTAESYIDLQVPGYFADRKHDLTIIITAYAQGTKYEFRKQTALAIVSSEKANYEECAPRAREMASSLKAGAVDTSEIYSELAQAEKAYGESEYWQASSLCAKALDKAQKLDGLFRTAEGISEKYISSGVESSSIEQLIALLKEDILNGNADAAQAKADQLELLLDLKEKDLQQTLPYQLGVLRKNIWSIVALIVMGGVIGIFASASFDLGRINKKIEYLDYQEEAVRSRLSQQQEKYFVQKIMPRRLYDRERDHYAKSLAQIEKTRSSLVLRKLKITSSRQGQDFSKVKAEAEEWKKRLQRKYFVEKTIDREIYRKLLTSADNVIRDIEAKIMMKQKAAGRPALPEAG